MPTEKLPLYQQVSELIHREIAAGHWRIGERLPTEAELAKTLQVAVGTLRKALAKLESDGWLERRQGSGTYVRQCIEGKAIYQFFHLELLSGGGVPSAEIVDISLSKNNEATKYLQSDKQWSIKRKRFLNHQLVAIEHIWIAAHHCKDFKKQDIHESLYLHYREHFDFWISHVEDQVSYGPAPLWVNKKLAPDSETKKEQTVGIVKRLAWSKDNQIKEFSKTYFDASTCAYIARWT